MSVDFHGTGVGHKDDLRALEHEYPRAFRELAVKTDHRAYPHRAALRVKVSDIKIAAGGQIALNVKGAGVDLRVCQRDVPEAVNHRHGVPRVRLVFFKIRDGDGHIKLTREIFVRAYVFAARIHGLGVPPAGIAGQVIADVPHLREKREVSAHRLCAAAPVDPLLQVFGLRRAGNHLKQRHTECHVSFLP